MRRSPTSTVCYKNWSSDQSSTSMETEAIAEGFKNSLTQGLIYGTIIGDGDSSVYARILEIDPYREYGVSVNTTKMKVQINQWNIELKS